MASQPVVVMQMLRAGLSLAKIALLAIALTNFGYLVTDAPATSQSARVAGPFGDWRVRDGAALYQASRYLRQQSYQHLVAAAVDGNEQRLVAARLAALDSLRQAPANPFGWSLLGWSEAVLGNDDAARAALVLSWQYAPESGALAIDRLLLAEALGLTQAAAQTPEIRLALQRDLRRARANDARGLEAVLEDAPGVAAFEQQSLDNDRLEGL